MYNKWNRLSELLPSKEMEDAGVDILFQNDKWITDYCPKGIRIGFLGSKDFIITAVWDEDFDNYHSEIIDITSEIAKQIKWKLIE